MMGPVIIAGLVVGAMVWMVVEPILHEGAHFVAARALGLSPFAITLGKGPILMEKRFGDVLVRVHAIPGSGMVWALPLFPYVRWKQAIFAGAGLILDIALLVLFVKLANFTAPATDPGQNAPLGILFTIFILYQALAIAVNAVPRDVQMEGLTIPNDGKQVVNALHGREDWIQQYERALARYDPSFRMQDSWLLRRDLPMVTLYSHAALDEANGRRAEAVEKFERILQDVKMQPAEQAALLDHLACIPIIHGDKTFLGPAQAWARKALELLPDCRTLHGTLGALLVEAGNHAEGLALLMPLTSESDMPVDRTLAACFSAKALYASGKSDEAGKLMQVASAGGVYGEVCARVQSELASAGTARLGDQPRD